MDYGRIFSIFPGPLSPFFNLIKSVYFDEPPSVDPSPLFNRIKSVYFDEPPPVDREKIQAGDHIYFWMHGFVYTHHGIFVKDDNDGKDGWVIHFDSSTKRKLNFVRKKTPKQTCDVNGCGYQPKGVLQSCLKCFSDDKPLYLYKYDVSTFYFLSHLRGGTCATAKSKSSKEVTERAKKLLDEGFGNNYNLISHNCEDFAFHCKTSSDSDDVNNAKRTSAQIHTWEAALLGVGVSYILSKFMRPK